MNSCYPSLRSHLRPKSRGGFTLIELLAVIAIISILLTVAAIGLNGMNNGKGTANGVTSAEAVFAEARTLATGNGTRARVLVNINDASDKENYLKRVLVIYEEIDPVTNLPKTDSWILSSRGALLPDGVYFSKSYSLNNSQPLSQMTLAASDNIKQAYAGNYLYYEFTSEGISVNPGATFVIGSGVRPNSAEQPIVTANAKRDFSGFVVWRNGTTSLFRSPEQVNIPNDVKTF